jgi:Sensors of blue-light using FAD.
MTELKSLEGRHSGNVCGLGLVALMYVSRSSLPLKGDYEAIEDIVQTAVSRNAKLQVTGALIYTEVHFAQVLEGPPAAVHQLMQSIGRDRRHSDVTVVAQHRIRNRRFGSWSMAYNAPSPYLDRHVKPLVAGPYLRRQGEETVERLFSNIKRLYDR